MKVGDFFKIPMKHIVFENSMYDINKEWSYGQEWVDFPDEKIKGISITVSENNYTLKSTDYRMLLPVRKKDIREDLLFLFGVNESDEADSVVAHLHFIRRDTRGMNWLEIYHEIDEMVGRYHPKRFNTLFFEGFISNNGWLDIQIGT
jgi:hypothetical protein